ncbi:MAG: hypothetical protein WBN60_16620 [Polyangiales bacterium]
MYWWVLASFSSVDLRTVNHNSTFYALELYSFVNVLSVIYFFYLNKKRSPYRYLVPVLGSGAPVASTLIFSLSEVFGGFENMPGGVADTLLALVWTQYQYFLFPLIFGYFGVKLLMEDWRCPRRAVVHQGLPFAHHEGGQRFIATSAYVNVTPVTDATCGIPSFLDKRALLDDDFIACPQLFQRGAQALLSLARLVHGRDASPDF